MAALNAPDAEEYVTALAEDNLEQLDDLANEEGPPLPEEMAAEIERSESDNEPGSR